MDDKQKEIRMIALDLDGTTLRRDKSLSERNRRAIQNAIAQGIHVVAASGRSFASLPAVVRELPGVEYAITSNGAAIYRMDSGERIHDFLLEPSSVGEILRVLPNHRIMEAFVDGTPYAQAEYVDNPMAYGMSSWGAEYVRATRKPVADIHAFLREHCREIDSIDIIVEGEAQQRAYREILQAKVHGIYITSSVSQLLEISHKDAGKASGIRWLSERLGIPMESVAAFGDAENDRDMILASGLGIAMGNAGDALKQAADLVTESNEDDGVGLVIEQILTAQRG